MPNSEKYIENPEVMTCFFCKKPPQFITDHDYKLPTGEVLGTVQVINKSNFIRGLDENKNTVYAHAACVGSNP